MPTITELFVQLHHLGYPIAYHHFNEPVASIPYIAYYATGYDPEFADNGNYVNFVPLTIELYTKTKDFTAESAVEGVLTSLGLPFFKDESWVEEEQLYQIIYETEVMQNG